jgi:hypothetical protein
MLPPTCLPSSTQQSSLHIFCRYFVPGCAVRNKFMWTTHNKHYSRLRYPKFFFPIPFYVKCQMVITVNYNVHWYSLVCICSGPEKYFSSNKGRFILFQSHACAALITGQQGVLEGSSLSWRIWSYYSHPWVHDPPDYQGRARVCCLAAITSEGTIITLSCRAKLQVITKRAVVLFALETPGMFSQFFTPTDIFYHRCSFPEHNQ